MDVVWIQLGIVLISIILGARVGGIGLGTFGGLGLFALTTLFGVQPTAPPVNVLFIILALITAVSALQAANGLKYLVMLAEKALRRSPSRITMIAPIVSYLFTLVTGTGHVVYSLLPVISEVAREEGIRPERPLSVSVIASQQAITACPISAATVALVGLLTPFDITLFHILAICLPATLTGVLISSLVMLRYGPELKDDPEYLRRLKAGEIQVKGPTEKMPEKEMQAARLAVTLFISGILLIILFASSPHLRPTFIENEATVALSMSHLIQLIMFSVASILLLGLKLDSAKVVKTPVAHAGLVAIICIFGIGWLGDSFVHANEAVIQSGIGWLVASAPWLFSIALFALSILLYSQAATVLALMPLGIQLGIPAPILIALFPAVNGYFFLPTYGTMLAAISFDETGTTRIGKYVLNHSFMLPGLVATVVSVLTGLMLTTLI